MNRINKLFQKKRNDVLNVYFTAGHPKLDSLLEIIPALEKAGADLVEVGMPYSDPLADGPTIQESSTVALKNGMQLDMLFNQLQELRKSSHIPIILMGYFNQMLQFGVNAFLNRASGAEVDGLIIPDLPMEVFEADYRALFEEKGMGISFLVTPQTADQRIKKAAELSSDFLYVVAQSSITGGKGVIGEEQKSYFEKVNQLKGDTPSLIGFGIHNKTTFDQAAAYANGAIIGSAFIRAVGEASNLAVATEEFVKGVRA